MTNTTIDPFAARLLTEVDTALSKFLAFVRKHGPYAHNVEGYQELHDEHAATFRLYDTFCNGRVINEK